MTIEGLTTLLKPEPMPDFVETPLIANIVDRALTYIAAGFPIHFRGAAGTGKTTLAMHVAAKLGRPVVMIHGDEEFSTSDLVGGEYGYRMRQVIDNFIHSVLKTEEEATPRWVDNRLTVAAKYGFTLVYDEFTRSRPEANNVLLSVLQEGLLNMPTASDGENYLQVHPDFVAIFTSNPEEYAGVYRSQDALLDRMVSLDLDYLDEETEIAITEAKSGIDNARAERIVGIARALRESAVCELPPTVRSCIKLAKAVTITNGSIASEDGLFRQICLDILASGCSRGSAKSLTQLREVLEDLVQRSC